MGIVLVTGARGFIGRHVARRLSGSGWRVIGIGHGAWPDAEEWGLVDWLNADIRTSNLDILADRHGAPDIVTHFAGGSTVGASLQSPFEDFTRTALTTAQLLEWVRTRAPDARVLGASSAAVYGGGHENPIDETVSPDPVAPYGTHKLVLEELFRSYAKNFELKTVILRMFSVYGPGLEKQLLWDLCQNLREQEKVSLGGTGDERRDWIHVDDIARLVETAAQAADATCPAYNGATGIATSIREVADAIAAAWGEGAVIDFNGTTRRGDPRSLVADMRKTRESLSFEADIRPEEGFPDYVRWFRGRLER